MSNIENKIRSLEIFKAIQNYLPNDHSNRQSLDSYIQQFHNQFLDPVNILDLGCGEGNSIDLFQRTFENVSWHGVDIEDSPEVRNRTLNSEYIQSFDGVNLPYPDNAFDLIYCNQVLEHVRFPDALIHEAFRVLKPNGWFIGSVSYLEPHHSYSIFNFTPFGVVRVFSDAGFALEEIRPGRDASYFVNRQLLNRSKILRFIWGNNYLHVILDLVSSFFRLKHRERNFLKVQFAGHLVFLATRPDNGDNRDEGLNKQA